MSTTSEVPAQTATTTGDRTGKLPTRIPILRGDSIALLMMGEGGLDVALLSELASSSGMHVECEWPRDPSEIRTDLETVIDSPGKSMLLQHINAADKGALETMLSELSDEDVLALVKRLPGDQLDALASLLVGERSKIEHRINSLRRQEGDPSIFRTMLRMIVQVLKAVKGRLKEIGFGTTSQTPALAGA